VGRPRSQASAAWVLQVVRPAWLQALQVTLATGNSATASFACHTSRSTGPCKVEKNLNWINL
jgi:hypothetical protein